MTVVIDSSALIAYLWDEPGADTVHSQLEGGLVSSVNFSEVALRLARDGSDPRPFLEDLLDSGLDVLDFTFPCALRLIDIRLAETRRGLALSLGDRCCLATALAEELPVLTADREWARFGDVLDVRLIR